MKKLTFILGIILFGTILVYADEGYAPKEEWMGIYIGEQKVGYAYTLTQEREDGGYIITTRTIIKTAWEDGEEQKIETSIKYYATEDYAMKSFITEIPQPNQPIRVEGEIVGDVLKINVYTGGEVEKGEIPLAQDTYFPVSMKGIVARYGLQEGSRYEVPIFDQSKFSKINQIISVEGKEKLTIGGKEYEAIKLQSTISGNTFYTWVTEEGEILKEVSSMGISMIKESREEALTIDTKELLNIASYYSIPSSVEIPSFWKTLYLKVELDGIDDISSVDIEDERQKILSKEPLCVRIITTSMGDIQQPTSEDLSATALIQSDSPLIKETAQKIVGDVMTDSIKVTKILNWMYENISKRNSPYTTSALEVLNTREGDCWEHSVLFCALARAAGIPARVCYGVVYNDGMFSYHAWNKVFVKGKWVAVDPVYHQFPCDATHIKLAEGEGSYILLTNIMGKLKIKVVEYR